MCAIHLKSTFQMIPLFHSNIPVANFTEITIVFIHILYFYFQFLYNK